MGRNVCLAIGISDAPPLDYLPGAINGARAIAKWAAEAGYVTEVLEDSLKPVGIAEIAAAITRLLPKSEKTDRFILYFAGHGLARDGAEDLWLLSQWLPRQRAVAANALRRRLERYGIGQLTVIADACRSLPSGPDTADLTPDAVLDRGPFDARTPDTDMFRASSRFREAFMIPGEDMEDDRCIFSGVIEQALTGCAPDAFHDVRKAITSASLTRHLRTAVPQRAASYNVELLPEITPGFLDPDDIYVETFPATPPTSWEWPSPARLAAMGTYPARMEGRRGWSTRAAPIARRAAPPSRILYRRGAIGRELPLGRARSALPSTDSDKKGRLLAAIESERSGAGEAERQRRFREYFDDTPDDGPALPRQGTALTVRGAAVRSVMTFRGARAEASPEGWRIDLHGAHSAPVLIELRDGRWAGAAVLRNRTTSFSITPEGVVGLAIRDPAQAPSPRAGEAIARLRAGLLAPAVDFDLAANLREEKSVDPVSGVIAAYLYDAQADVASIRQIAYFLAMAGDPIPYDLALLARLSMRREDGRLIADVPAIPARQPRSPRERSLPWTYRATPGISAEVAGAFPWFRQGWWLIDDDAPLADMCGALRNAPFTTLDAQAGARLAVLLSQGER